MLERIQRLTPSAARVRHGAVALAATLAFGAVAAVQSAAADTSPVESLSTTSMPTNYDHSSNLGATACGSESCVSLGSYEDSSGVEFSLILPITDGVAGGALNGSLPTGASSGYHGLNDVSCWGSASCVAVGTYTDSSGQNQAMVVPIDDGVPQTPYEVTLPSGGTSAWLYGVSCSSSGSCVAVGQYEAAGVYYGLVVNIGSDGVPASGLPVQAPPSGVSPQQSGLYDVSCQPGGPCVAVGFYQIDQVVNASDYGAEVVAITAGVPGSAQAVTLPSNATQNAGFQDADVEHVSCPGTGSCAAVGSYVVGPSNDTGDLVIPITNGIAGTAVPIQLPGGATGTQITFGGLSCQSSDWCVGAGTYSTSGGDRPVLIPFDNGAPTPSGAVEVSLPAGAETGGQSAELNDVSCPTLAGACLAVGDYRDANGNSAGLTAAFSGGVVGGGMAPPVPTDESTGAYYATAGCAASSCVATGQYGNIAGTSPLVVLSAQAPLAIGTTGLPGGAVDTAYSQTLSATGAWGAYSWAVSSGSLPSGLSLNAQTGVISGTPTAGGTSAFTVTATGTGVPVQTAAQAYSLTITAPPASSGTPPSSTPPSSGTPPSSTPPATPAATPKLSLLTRSALVSRNRFGLKLRCSAAPCKGAARLQITRTYTVKHGKKQVRKHRTVVIATVHFSLAAGQTKTLKATLNAAGRKALAARHRLSVTVVATVTGANRASGHLTLRAAPTKHKKPTKQK